MSQSAQKFWDKQATKYDGIENQFEPAYKSILTKTSEYLNQNDMVLDYGCATGNKAIEFSSRVRRIHGLDISAGMIREANRKKDELKIPNISFSQGTIFNPELERGSFDKIIAFSIIHLLEDKEKVIQRIHELLKPGGLFFSTTACLKNKMAFKNRLNITTLRFLKRLGIFPLHLNIFRPEDVEKLIKDQNFNIVEAEYISYEVPACFIIAVK